ncbi:MAG: GGDEF domain-containing phosphodiesterase, partial [Pseudomonadota bacterium]|nr:GGDEF domain-containing phosphodiesterase [Pseudomonadota bacterium]
ALQGAITVAEKLLAEVGAPYYFKGTEILVGASIGIAPFPASGQDVETLMNHADIAMYRSKESGRHGYQCFTQEMRLETTRQRAAEQALERALHAGEFELFYQPRVATDGQRIAALEALLRWRDNGTLKSPHSFVPLLERTGLIGEVGDWVVASVCGQIKAWREAGCDVPLVSINLSASQLRDVGLSRRLRRILDSYDIRPDTIEFEITETLLLGKDETVKRVLQELRELGCSIAIDDFGAGYCSFAYLRDYRVDVIKIDRGFISGITAGSTEALLVGGIIRLARDLSLKVVIEGVERQEEVEVLLPCDPDEFQGYLFHRPMDAAAIRKLLCFAPDPPNSDVSQNWH